MDIRAQNSIDRWMDKEAMVYKYNGILPSRQKEWTLAFEMIWMETEYIMISENKLEKDKYMISLIYGI